MEWGVKKSINRTEWPETNPYEYSQPIVDKNAKTTHTEKRTGFSTNGTGAIDVHMQNSKLNPSLTAYTETNLKRIKELNVKLLGLGPEIR